MIDTTVRIHTPADSNADSNNVIAHVKADGDEARLLHGLHDQAKEAVPKQLGATAPGPWLTVLQAARHLGYHCLNGRAPNSVYGIVQEIGYRLNQRDWRVHVDDLDRHVRTKGCRA